jgi:NADP-dependent 3-hydroxy acid dehydrogenase YdfG
MRCDAGRPVPGRDRAVDPVSLEVNVYGVLTGCQLALPQMVQRRSGHIINIASLSGLIPLPGQVVYVGAKYAVVGLSTRWPTRWPRTGSTSR